MPLTGNAKQLAAAINENGHDLAIHGRGDDWSILVRGAPDTNGAPLWLSSARQPTDIRSFKTLEAAHGAAVDVYLMTDKGKAAKAAQGAHVVTIPVTMVLRG